MKKEYKEWAKELSKKMKGNIFIKNKWKTSVFKKMYKEGLSVNEAHSLWVLGH